MVRVISEKLFSPPRSRHSSGETVDKELARAVETLAAFNSRRLELSDYESSSDSHWDSEVDIDGDCTESHSRKDLPGGAEGDDGTDIVRKRKERRRERNKLSAQAYRVRRKEQSVKQQNMLKSLQDKNTNLKNMVSSLEDQLEKVRHSLRHRLCTTITIPTTTTTPNPDTPTSTTTTTVTTPGRNSNSASPCPIEASPIQRPLPQTEAPSLIHQQSVDNDRSHRQQVSPVVDNFLFSKPQTPATTPPVSAMTPASTLTFPSSTPVMGARHTNLGASFLPCSPLPTISEKPDALFDNFDNFSVHRHPHHHLHHHQPQHSDLNANAEPNGNANTNNVNANMGGFGVYQSTGHTNNNNIFQGRLGRRPEALPPKVAFKFMAKA